MLSHRPLYPSERALSIHLMGLLDRVFPLRAVFGNLVPGDAPGNGPGHRMMAGIMPRHGAGRATGNAPDRLGLAGTESRKANPRRNGQRKKF